MPGTKTGGEQARDTNYRKYGRDFYRVQGAKGGAASRTGGFGAGAAGKELARRAGAIGGAISRRGKALTPRQKDIVKRNYIANYQPAREKYAARFEESDMQVSKLSKRFGVKR